MDKDWGQEKGAMEDEMTKSLTHLNDWIIIFCWVGKTHRIYLFICCCSVAKSCLDSLQPHGLQHAMLLCPSLPPRVCPTSCPLNWRCHPNILSSVILFSFCLQSFPASGSFPKSWLFVTGGQSIRASASAPIPPVSILGWSPLGLTDSSPCSPRDPQESSPAQFESINSSALCLMVRLSYLYMTTEKTIALTIWTSVGKVMFLLLMRCLGLS